MSEYKSPSPSRSPHNPAPPPYSTSSLSNRAVGLPTIHYNRRCIWFVSDLYISVEYSIRAPMCLETSRLEVEVQETMGGKVRGGGCPYVVQKSQTYWYCRTINTKEVAHQEWLSPKDTAIKCGSLYVASMSLNGVWSEKIDKIVTFGRPSVLKLVRSAGSPNVPGDCPINYISQHLVARADPCDARNWVSLGICHPGVNQPTRGVKVRAGWMIYDPDLSSIEHEHRVSKKRSTSTVANWNGSFGCKIVTRL